MIKTAIFMTSILITGVSLSGCQPSHKGATHKSDLIKSHSLDLNNWFETRYQDQLARSPMDQTYLGEKTNRDKLDDVSQLSLDESAALQSAWLADMRRDFDIDRLL